MFNYIVRRSLQMVVVLFFSSAASYALLNLAPGGPLTFLTSIQKRINQEDIARIRAYFELDLYLPYRFSRWLVGWPRGPIAIGGQEFLGSVVVGCRQPLDSAVRAPLEIGPARGALRLASTNRDRAATPADRDDPTLRAHVATFRARDSPRLVALVAVDEFDLETTLASLHCNTFDA